MNTFAEYYNDWSITTNEIRKKLKLTRTEYDTLRKQALEDGLIETRPLNYRKIMKQKKSKNYYFLKSRNGYDRYVIRKNGEYYCCCKTKEQAKLIVERLRECDWDKSQAQRIKQEVIRNA